MKNLMATLGLVLLASTNYAQIPTDGLIGHWCLNNSGEEQNSSLLDMTNNGATGTQDRGSNALSAMSFDGTNQNMTLNTPFNTINMDITMSVWVRTGGGVPGDAMFRISSTPTFVFGSTNSYGIRFDGGGGGTPSFSYYLNMGGTVVYVSTNVTDNQWHHLVGIARSSTNMLEIYVDGSLSNTFNIGSSGSNLMNLQYLSLGGEYSDDYYTGDLDDATLYDRALSSAEVTQLFQEQACARDVIDVPTMSSWGVLLSSLLLLILGIVGVSNISRTNVSKRNS